MATTFLEPMGDATYLSSETNNGGFWFFSTGITYPTISSTIKHGNHVRSTNFAYSAGDGQSLISSDSIVQDSGTRLSIYIYISAYPDSTYPFLSFTQSSGGSSVVTLYLTSTGILQLYGASQLGGNGPTLALGQWYRVSIAYTITSTTINTFNVFVDGKPAISVTNGTLNVKTTTCIVLGNTANLTFNFYASDLYIDNSSSLTDTGDIWVTAKRPFSNGTTNGFTTQIGTGGSGYGSGHAQQVNQRQLNTTKGWSMVGTGSAITEEYTIEGASSGDIDISRVMIIDIMGWVYAKSLVAETGQIKLINTTSNINLENIENMYTVFSGTNIYPSGGTDIGIITDTTLTTVSLYECGIVIAYIPRVGPFPINTI